MNITLKRLSKNLSTKIGFGILLIVGLIFFTTLGYVFYKARQIVKQESFEHADMMLSNTVLRVSNSMNEVETATQNMVPIVLDNLNPDSLLVYTRRMLETNSDFNGCSITTEPGFFPQYGRYFSAYSVRQGDSITTVREKEYEYYEKPWYSSPRDKRKGIWVGPYDDFNVGTLSSPCYIASYGIPLFTADSIFVGVISTDISLPTLSKVVAAEKPYPNAYCLMLDHTGRYLVHPDTSRIIKQTIFTRIEATTQPDVVVLSHEMVAGKKGAVKAYTEGRACYVFYQPVKQAGWSIALVCPEKDIFSTYNRLLYIVIPLTVIGLILMLVFCRITVRHFIAPLRELTRQTRHISDGHYEAQIKRSRRTDIVGRLQDDFLAMQQSLKQYIGHLRQVNDQAQQRNAELLHANELAKEAERKKDRFLQDMSHQIRTPLNIIMGFAQVLNNNYGNLSQQEVESITDTMQKNATAINRMVNMLAAASLLDSHLTTIERNDIVGCNAIIRKAASIYDSRPPRTQPLILDTNVADSLCIKTNAEYLNKALHELLYNAKKFTPDGIVTLRLRANISHVIFTVEDNGPGIATEDRESIFSKFTKLDDFSEGLGLGLSISRQFARLLGGELSLDATYTQGSRFVLRIPKV